MLPDAAGRGRSRTRKSPRSRRRPGSPDTRRRTWCRSGSLTVGAPPITWSLMRVLRVRRDRRGPRTAGRRWSRSRRTEPPAGCRLVRHPRSLEFAAERMGDAEPPRRAGRDRPRRAPAWGSRRLPRTRCCGTMTSAGRAGSGRPAPRGHRFGHQQVVGTGLGVVHLDDPVAVAVEHPGVDQFVFGLQPVARRILVDEVLIGGTRPGRASKRFQAWLRHGVEYSQSSSTSSP